jgi:hypothetical protein
MVSNVRVGLGVTLLLGLTLSALLMLIATAPAQAQTCQTEITELRDATVAAETFTNKKDQAGLVGKLDSANAKLTEGKTADALKNLNSFREKVITLDAQDKLGEDEAKRLVSGADDAIACITALDTQTPTAA